MEADLLTGLLFDELLYLEAVHVFIWLSRHPIFWPVWILHVDDMSSVHLNGRFITCRPSTKKFGRGEQVVLKSRISRIMEEYPEGYRIICIKRRRIWT